MEKITQDGRLMSIQTPLGKDYVLIKNFWVSEGISKLFKMDIDLVHEEKPGSTKPTEIDPKSMLGQAITVTVEQLDDNKTKRFFNGVINSISQLGRDQNFTHYNIEVVPQLWKLTQIHRSQIFQQMTVPDILKKMFEGLEVVWAIQGHFHPRNYCVQYRETDFAFASRLMERRDILFLRARGDNAQTGSNKYGSGPSRLPFEKHNSFCTQGAGRGVCSEHRAVG
ncbi:MAG: contractile injection system protein, VgrG/Pvc8 family [Pyrinomonadaceae bacterium]